MDKGQKFRSGITAQCNARTLTTCQKDETLRLALIEEYEAVLDIFSRAVVQMNDNGIRQWDELYPDKATLLTDIQREQMYVYVIDNRPIACVVLNDEQDSTYKAIRWSCQSGRCAVVHRLCVDPLFQNGGVARRMLGAAEELLKQKNYISIRLDAFSQNPFALRLYERAGYTNRGEISLRKGVFYCYEKLL
jgi:GNAT superfamily N-acetyltransferase